MVRVKTRRGTWWERPSVVDSEYNANRVADNNSWKEFEVQLVVADTEVAADANEGLDSNLRVKLMAAVGLPVVAEACGNDCE